MRLFSLAFLTVSDISPVEAIYAAAESGYAMVGLRMLPATAEESAYGLLTDDSVFQGVVHALASTGLAVCDVELIRLGPEMNVDQFYPFFERAMALHARHVIVVGDDGDRARLTDNFAHLCERSALFGLTMNLEPMPWTKVPDLTLAEEVVEASGQKNAGVLIDALHFHRSEIPLEKLSNLSPDRVNIFQICDASAAFDPAPEALRNMARTARLIPGEGELDLYGFISCVPESAIVSVEVPNRDLINTVPARERVRRALDATRSFYTDSL